MFLLKLFTFCLCLIATGKDITAHEILNDVQKEQIIEWGDINIICNVSTHQQKDIYWENADKTFHADGIELLIHNISRDSAGLYICYVIGESTVAVQYVLIDVLYPAEIITLNIPRDILYANETFIVTVTVEGNPEPETTLLSERTGEAIYSADGVGTRNMTIFSVQCEDAGTYLLNCVNGFGSSSRSFNMSVFCSPKVDQNFKPSFELKPRLGDQLTLEMQSVGFPQPNFTWWFNEKTIEHTDEGYKSFVEIHQMTVDNFGTYRLYMENLVGSSSYFYYVIPAGPPEPPTGLQLLWHTSDSAMLKWISGYSYNTTQMFILMNFELDEFKELAKDMYLLHDKDKNEITYNIDGLEQDHDYNITVVSRNLFGTCPVSTESITFTTKDDHVSKTYGLIALFSVFAIGMIYAVVVRLDFRKKLNQRRKELQLKGTKYGASNSSNSNRQNSDSDTDCVDGQIRCSV